MRAESCRQGCDQLQKHFCVRTEAVRYCLCFEENCRGLCREGDYRVITTFPQCPLKGRTTPNAIGEGGEFWRTSPSSWDLMAAEGGVARAPQASRATMGNYWVVLAPYVPGLMALQQQGRTQGHGGNPGDHTPLQGLPTSLVLLVLRDVSPGPCRDQEDPPLPKSTTTSRTLPRTHLVSVAPPGPHGVPRPPHVPGCAPVSGSVPPRADATSLSPTLPAPKSQFQCSAIGCRPPWSGTIWPGR